MIQSDILTNEDLGKQPCCILEVMFNLNENVQRRKFILQNVKPFLINYIERDIDSERERKMVWYMLFCVTETRRIELNGKTNKVINSQKLNGPYQILQNLMAWKIVSVIQ